MEHLRTTAFITFWIDSNAAFMCKISRKFLGNKIS